MYRTSNSLRLASCILLLLFLSSCSTPTAIPTSTNIPTNTVVPLTSTPAPTATATLVPAPPRPQYQMNVVLDYAAKAISVGETIIYPNHTGQTLNDLMLAVEPNLWPNCFTLVDLVVDGTAITNYTLDGQKLSFSLAAPLAPEATLTIQIEFKLVLPGLQEAHGIRPQIFGFSQAQMNLTDWYPFVVPNIAGQWVLHDPWYYGEHLVYDAADFVVNVRPADPAVNPIIASSGEPSQNGEWTTYTLTSGRTFVISASTEYKTVSVQVGNATVTSYYFPLYDATGKVVLDAAAQALGIYAQKYSTPYSHKTFSIVMGDFNDGMEFSGLVFMPRGAYNIYNGTPESLLTTVTVHETSHQWWFEQVADDQAMQPWLDEAFAAYSEHIYYETAYPNSVSWWWSYWYPRVGGTDSLPWIDISIYNAQGFIPYTNTVYLHGAHFLDDLRTRIGDGTFFAFLQDYLKQENGKITTSADFFRILRTHTQVDFSDLIKQYFQNNY